MRLKTLTYSIGFHIVIIVIAIFGLPFIAHHDVVLPPPPMMVEFVKIAKKTQTIERAKPKPPKPKIKKEIKKDTPPKAKPLIKKEEKPKPPKIEKPSKPPVSSGKKPKPTPKVETIPPLEKPKPKKEEKPKDKPNDKKEEFDFSSVLKNLTLDDDKAQPEVVDEKANLAPLGLKLTISEQDALRRQLEKCWNVPIGARDIQEMAVEIKMDINPDRTLRQAVILDENRYNRDSFFRAVADSAMRAIYNPACSPFALPPDKYETWKRTIVNFNPRDMF
jgi:hypothetical protein